MNREELLRLVVNQAQFNGFEFRRWFQINIQPAWPGTESALAILATESRFFALVFSHDFASCFWKTGTLIGFRVPSTTYPRVNRKGEVLLITRKPFTRRIVKPDVWKYHLARMTASEDPFAYLSRFLPELDEAFLQADEIPEAAAKA